MNFAKYQNLDDATLPSDKATMGNELSKKGILTKDDELMVATPPWKKASSDHHSSCHAPLRNSYPRGEFSLLTMIPAENSEIIKFIWIIPWYCGWLRNPAPQKGWLKPKQNSGMFTTVRFQLVQGFKKPHPQYHHEQPPFLVVKNSFFHGDICHQLP